MVCGRGPISSISMWTSSFLCTIYGRDCLFPIVQLGTLENHLDIPASVYFWDRYSVSLVYICLYDSATLFGYCFFVVSFEIRQYMAFILVLPFQDSFGSSVYLRFHVNFRVFKIFLLLCHWDFDCTESLDYLWQYGHFNNILSFPIHEYGMSFHLFVLLVLQLLN